MKRTWTLFFALCVLALMLSGTTARADVTETFDGLSEVSYGTYDYNGFHMENTLCTSQYARSGNAPRLRNEAGSLLEYVGTDGNGKDDGVGVISFWYRSWDDSPAAVYDVKVSIDGGGYTNIGTQISNTSTEYAEWTYTLNNSSDNIKIRIERVSGERLHVDDYSITDYGSGPDTTPPEISSIAVINNTEIDVLFNEAVEQTTAEDTDNYTVDQSVGHPLTADRDDLNTSLVHLTFNELDPNTYTLTINGVEDIAGNPCVNIQDLFTLDYQGSILISEVMYDDTGSGLTDIDWVEIYNTTDSTIDISGWILTDDDVYPPAGEGAIMVPELQTIAPGEYLVLGKEDLPDITGEVICTEYYGTFAPANAGDNLALYTSDTDGVLVDGSLTCFYPDSAGPNLGHSIERCDVSNGAPLWCEAQWHVSTNTYSAGRYQLCTPGAANTPCPVDNEPPEIVTITVVSATELDVEFNEPVDETTAEAAGNYSVDNGVGNPSTAVRDAEDTEVVHLTFGAVMDPNTYILTVNGVEDLNENACVNETGGFIIPPSGYEGTILISEVMYDDTASGENPDIEWVEIYNTTDSTIDISDWFLTDDSSYPPTSEGSITIPASTTIDADEYLVLIWAEQTEITGDFVILCTGGMGLGNSGGDNIAMYNAPSGGYLIDGSLTTYYPDLAVSNAGNSIERCDVYNGAPGWDAATWAEATNEYGPGRYQHCTPGAVNTPCPEDTDPPELVSVTVISATEIDVEFSEWVDETTSEVNTNYSVDFAVGNPETAVRDDDSNEFVRLTFASELGPNTYTLTVNNVEDLNENVILPGSQIQFVIEAMDYIIFTEVMPDPNFVSTADSAGEWFEIYNTTDTTVHLDGYIIHDEIGSDTLEGPVEIAPGQFFVFCTDGDSIDNGGVPVDYAYHYGTGSWGLSLRNTGETLSIRNPSGSLVTTLSYYGYPYSAGSSAQLRDVTWDTAVDTNWCIADTVWDGAWNSDEGTPGEMSICAEIVDTFTTICDIREIDANGLSIYNDVFVNTHGLVTHIDLCRTNAYVEDNGCALLIYGNFIGDNLPGIERPMAVGDSIVISGVLDEFQGLIEFGPYTSPATTITFLSEGNPVPDHVNIPASLIDQTVDGCTNGADAYESLHIYVEDVTYVDGGGTFAGNTTYDLTSDIYTITVYVHNCDTLIGQTIPTGAIDLYGVLGQYDNSSPDCQGYQIMTGRIPAPPSCVDPEDLTIYRVGNDIELRWFEGVDQTCTCFKIYTATDSEALFPDEWTEIDCVCDQTSYTHVAAFSSKLFYRVVAVDACE